MSDLNKPQRLFMFLDGMSKLTREYGVVIGGDTKFQFEDKPEGLYCVNTNNTGPELGWVEMVREQAAK